MSPDLRRRCFIAFAGFSGALAVALGAYAAHGLAGAEQELADKASRFQIYHALALLAVAAMQERGGRFAALSGVFFCLGSLLFCGALYAIALAAWPAAPIAPYGGTSFILGWLFLGISALRSHRPV